MFKDIKILQKFKSLDIEIITCLVEINGLTKIIVVRGDKVFTLVHLYKESELMRVTKYAEDDFIAKLKEETINE